MKKEQILGVEVCNTTSKQLIRSIDKDIRKNEKSSIIAINPEKIMLAYKSPSFMSILNNATYQIPDGIGIIFASKKLNGDIKSRITGIDLMGDLLKLANNKRYKVFLYGANDEVVKLVKLKILDKYSKISIVGMICGYEEDNDYIINTINESRANILFVATGSPKQERWIHDNYDKLNVNILQGVGGSFDVYSGKVKRCPVLFRKCGLEWLYRLMTQPSRIGRYRKIISFLRIIYFKKGEVVNEKN